MTRPVTLIVLAHPEPASFTAAWARSSIAASEALGHRVLVSDLVASGFDPVERAAHYGAAAHAPFDPLKAQERAAASGELPDDVLAEVHKIRAADRIVLHFPLWWFGPPAILKGWFDRCLVHGALHSVEERFDRGRCVGKRALLCVSTGSSDVESSPSGKEGDVQLLLWPLAYALRYLGVTVHALVHGVHGYHDGAARDALQARLRATLDAQQALLDGLECRQTIAFNRDADFDAAGRLNEQSLGRIKYPLYVVRSF